MADNVQLYQVTNRLVPNFKLAKILNNRNGNTYQKLLDGKKGSIVDFH